MSYDGKVQLWLTIIAVCLFVAFVAGISKAVQKWSPPTHGATTGEPKP